MYYICDGFWCHKILNFISFATALLLNIICNAMKWNEMIYFALNSIARVDFQVRMSAHSVRSPITMNYKFDCFSAHLFAFFFRVLISFTVKYVKADNE